MRKNLKELVNSGGVKFAAKYLNVSPGTISKWMRRNVYLEYTDDGIQVNEVKTLKRIKIIDNNLKEV